MALAHSSLTAPRNAVGRTQYNLFLHSPIRGYLGYFGSLAPANKAATNNYVKCLYGTWGKVSKAVDLNLSCTSELPWGLSKLTARLPPAQLNRLHWGVGTQALVFFKSTVDNFNVQSCLITIVPGHRTRKKVSRLQGLWLFSSVGPVELVSKVLVLVGTQPAGYKMSCSWGTIFS